MTQQNEHIGILTFDNGNEIVKGLKLLLLISHCRESEPAILRAFHEEGIKQEDVHAAFNCMKAAARYIWELERTARTAVVEGTAVKKLENENSE